jgi:hypothetical protein
MASLDRDRARAPREEDVIPAIGLDDAFHGVLLAAAGNDELRLRAHDVPVSDRLPGRAELLSPASVPQSLILVTMADKAPTRAG